MLYSRTLQGSKPGKLLQVLAKLNIQRSIDLIQPIFDIKTYYYREFHLFILLYEFQLYILHFDRYFR